MLLRNEGPLLPLPATGSLAVIGRLAALPNLGDRGSSDTRPAAGSVVTPLAGLRAAAPAMAIRHEEGRNLAAAAALAAASEAAVVVVGLDWRHEGEHIHPGDIAPVLEQVPPPAALVRWLGWRRLRPLWRQLTRLIAALARLGSARPGSHFAAGDRTCLGLPAGQLRLIRAVAAANPRTVVVLMGGGAIVCEQWRQQVPAILLLWYPGEQGGAALADVIFGRVSPSGRLPFALPSSEAHLPPFNPRARRLTYDLWHGYRRLRHQGLAAAFPFGWGLSYAAFAHEGLVAQLVPAGRQQARPEEPALAVSVVVRNAAAVPGDEVLQVYVEPPGLRLPRAARQLVGFQRLSLDAGQALPITLLIPLRRLAYFDEARDAFVLEAGCHRVLVAPHAEARGLAVELTLGERVLEG
ncbi:glycoside hydrolase family 3 C-terminal domain-containing protein [Synechococcus sp. ATX 2A4]|uniref:glycoside hydrolase family 3 C-terminal domain-containing protein n=1 Tax=Synechococcus sp. ATX 2A4 TaxID=2823727 RepID=UPI0020CFC4E1|nr:glycoside hydrolase family 3 C-terminal domain-containing protein [Synechococcus sp. ATX 2A4]